MLSLSNFKDIIFKNKKKLIIFLLVVLVASGIIFVTSRSSNKLDNNSYTVLHKGSNINKINVKGSVETDEDSHIYNTSGCVIKEVTVKLGDTVKNGDVLAILDTLDLETEIKQLEESIKTKSEINAFNLDKAKKAYDHAYELSLEGSNSDVVNAEANLAAAKLDLEDKQRILDYNQGLIKLGAISEQDLKQYEIAFENAKNTYDKANVALDNIKASVILNLNAAKNDYETAKATYEDKSSETLLERKKQQLNTSNITAPINGVISNINISAGNATNGNTLFTIENPDNIKITASVKEVDIQKIKIGQKVEIKTDSTGNEIIDGEVVKIYDTAKNEDSDPLKLKDDSNDDEAEYNVDIKINNTDYKLKLGMNAQVNIILEEKKDVFTVPSQCILKNTEDNDCIYIAEKQGNKYIVKELPVTLGSESDTNIEIISDQLEDNIIVLNTPLDYEIGSTVKIKY